MKCQCFSAKGRKKSNKIEKKNEKSLKCFEILGFSLKISFAVFDEIGKGHVFHFKLAPLEIFKAAGVGGK